MLFPSYPPWHDHSVLQLYLAKSKSYGAPHLCRFTRLRSKYSPEDSALNMLSLNVRGQVSHQFRTAGKATVSYILIFAFIDSRI
jgi:hypothetical protein